MLDSWLDFWACGLTRPEHWAHARQLYPSPEHARRAIFRARSCPLLSEVDCWETFRQATDDRLREHQQMVRVLEESAPVTFVEPAAQPPLLRRRLNDAPVLVWGAVERLHAPGTGVVGTRRLHDPAPELAAFVDHHVAASDSLISGGAFGVDAFAHRSALRHNVPAVIVIAGGLGHAGPAGHRGEFKRIIASGGALVSTYPAWVKPAVWSFLERNQVLAALSSQVTLVRAPLRSGARSTCAHARKMNIPVRVVPRLDDSRWWAGCEAELSRGATLLGPSDAARDGEGAAGAVVAVGGEWDGTVEQLAGLTNQTVDQLLAWLTVAELKGEASSFPGGRWSLRGDALQGLRPPG